MILVGNLMVGSVVFRMQTSEKGEKGQVVPIQVCFLLMIVLIK